MINFLQELISKGMTQKEIAEKAGINQSLVCKLMKGGDCNAKTLVKIAKAFEVTTDHVLGIDQSKEPDPPPKPRRPKANSRADLR